jgi:steroid 5-alpha reductase family enzyme
MSKETQRSLTGIIAGVLVGIGVAWAGSQGGVSVGGFPLFALGVALAFIIQWIAFVPAYLLRTEKFYDLTGSITYISVVVLAVLMRPAAEVDTRGWLLFGMVIIWTVRLGSFLFLRIKAAGEDRRFREIKQSFPRFLLAWTIQGLWVVFSLSAALVAITSLKQIEFGAFAIIGTILWLFGFAIEVIADRQKSAFKANPENKDKFIQTGLWAWSRHPNYFGEIVLWIGIAIIALPVLQGWQFVSLISPVFITLLLTRISGVPMLEERADEKWGGQEDYEAYKANTSVLIPLPPSASR